MKNKKGISAIVGTVILIALVLVAGTIVWTVVRGMVEGKLEGADSCVDVFEKVTLNGQYTCFNGVDDVDDVTFSITRSNINVSSIVVVISGKGQSKSFTFDKDGADPDTDLDGYSDVDDLTMPEMNEGKTYIYTGDIFTETPDRIAIAPVVGDKQCDGVDEIVDIPDCYQLGL